MLQRTEKRSLSALTWQMASGSTLRTSLRLQWVDVPMAASQSCLVPWKGCTIPAPRAPDNTVLPCTLEFTVIGPNGDEDAPYGGGRYQLAGPGGYKLSVGLLRPFPQACRAPIMLVRRLV